MTIQDVFNTTAVKEIEIEILELFAIAQKDFKYGTFSNLTISRLLAVRKRLLDEMFVMDEHYKTLLGEFNEAMKVQLLKMRERTITLHNSAKNGLPENHVLITTGKCFLGYEYSKIHPIQTNRAKKMWCVLNCTYDNYMPLYTDGVSGEFTINGNELPDTENQLLWLSDVSKDNWNEGLDPKMTEDMNLIHAFHNVWSHMGYSIFDLLWVRDFETEITVENDYSSALPAEECDYPNWDCKDYLD